MKQVLPSGIEIWTQVKPALKIQTNILDSGLFNSAMATEPGIKEALGSLFGLHRIGGPALTNPNGTQEWWLRGDLHRLDGPAIIKYTGEREWWIKGVQIRCNQNYQVIAGITDEEMSTIILKYGAVR